jgi:hypothetical protein
VHNIQETRAWDVSLIAALGQVRVRPQHPSASYSAAFQRTKRQQGTGNTPLLLSLLLLHVLTAVTTSSTATASMVAKGSIPALAATSAASTCTAGLVGSIHNGSTSGAARSIDATTATTCG